MITFRNRLFNVPRQWQCSHRFKTQDKAFKNKNFVKNDPSLIRNIGILAHIDAGKTTTTERMLFYAGTTHNMGEVHHGNTVTDFMDQERERGITITAAAVTFPWEQHQINLLDTPGHIDFTMEVEQTLNVMDGAVVVLDGSAGVEAQTMTVWRQADKYNIPRIVYVNKMDRTDSQFDQSIDSIRVKLNTEPIVVQLPVKHDGKLTGIIDVLRMEKLIWDSRTKGVTYERKKLLEGEDGVEWKRAVDTRVKLTEQLADLDDNLANIIIKEETVENIPYLHLRDSVRKVTLSRTGVAVTCGSSYKNIGVQTLIDSVIYYLPGPVSYSNDTWYKFFNDNLSARVFKVRHDQHRGPVTFMRIYSGRLAKSQKIYNITQDKSEQLGKLLVAYADDYEETNEVCCGNIAAVTGLKSTVTGDVITSTSSVANNVKKKLSSKQAVSDDLSRLLNTSLQVPEPVFFCSIEPPSQAQQGTLDKSLSELSREDPSLRVSYNEETGQIVLGGMGELHLDVIRERIKKEYKVDCELGQLQIAYKEALLSGAKETHVVQHKIGSSSHSVNITMSAIVSDIQRTDKELLLLDKSPESASNISSIFPKHLLAVKHGVESALTRGPKLSFPVINAKVMLHWFEIGRGTSETIITAAVAQCVRKLLTKGGTKLLEPIMLLEVVTPGDVMNVVLVDLGKRRGVIQNIDVRGSDKVLTALIPLSSIMGYSTTLRTITSGTGSFSMEFLQYREMSEMDEAEAIKSITGIDV